MTQSGNGLVSLGEIKELAGVGRPTVSNWRRRHTKEVLAVNGSGRAPFPEPVGGSDSKPLFDADEIAVWLDSRPVLDSKPNDDGTFPSYGQRFRRELRKRRLVALKGKTGAEDLIVAALAQAALYGRGQSRSEPEATEIDHEIRAAATKADHLARQAMDELIATEGPAGAADQVLELSDRLESELAVTATPAEAARLVSALAGKVTDLDILDMTAGTGGLLLALNDIGRAASAHAVETDRLRRLLLRCRLYAHKLDRVRIHADQAGLGLQCYDIVLADPPYASGERDRVEYGPLHWAREAAGQLAPSGRAFVLVPAWTMTRPRAGVSSPTVDMRDWLLARGHLDAIIQLPRRIHAFRTGAEYVLLVLRPARESDPVLLIDADRVAQRSPDEWIAEVVATILGDRTARAGTSRRLAVFASGPGGERLLDGRSVLPAHRVAEPPKSTGDHFELVQDARRAAAAAMPKLRDWIGGMGIMKRPSPERHRKLNEYLKAGQLRLLSGHRIKDADLSDSGLPIIGREEMLGILPVGQRRIDATVLTRYPQVAVTEVGDVFLLAEHGVRCRVDEAGGCVLLAPVQGMRIEGYRKYLEKLAMNESVGPDELWMRPQPLAQLLEAPRNQQRSSGSLVRRVSVRDMDLPQLSSAEVTELEAILIETENHRAKLRRQLVALDNLADRLAAGFADGALALRRRRL